MLQLVRTMFSIGDRRYSFFVDIDEMYGFGLRSSVSSVISGYILDNVS